MWDKIIVNSFFLLPLPCLHNFLVEITANQWYEAKRKRKRKRKKKEGKRGFGEGQSLWSGLTLCLGFLPSFVKCEKLETFHIGTFCFMSFSQFWEPQFPLIHSTFSQQKLFCLFITVGKSNCQARSLTFTLMLCFSYF